MRKIIFYITILLIVWCPKPATAQSSMPSTLEKIRKAYADQPNLSFSMQYLYSKETAPNTYIDSLSGEYKLCGTLVWSMLDSVETIANADYHLTVYHKEKLLFVDQAENQASVSLQFLDSLMKRDNVVLTKESSGQLTFTFPENSSYRTATLVYNPSTYLIEKISYSLPGVPGAEDFTADAYLIQLRFFAYHYDPIDKAIYAVDKYVKRDGSNFLPSEKYADYNILIGSSNVQNQAR